MSISNPLRKAMIVIAVSKYSGSFHNLPGTLTSARRIADWARQPGDGRDYTVLEITDAANAGNVTVSRLRSEITTFLQSAIYDRLVVYFAGHGFVRSAADQYWLLTDAANDDREGVNVRAFRHGLTRQGIGAHRTDLSQGQLCFIVDACRNTSDAALNFVGDPILSGGGVVQRMQTDLFFATMLGMQAYQPTGTSGQAPYCLFSDTLTEALEGSVPRVIDSRHHPYAPVIANNLLADYLDSEVPKRAARLNETMAPDTFTGIRMDHNYYDVLSSSAQQTVDSGDDPEYTSMASEDEPEAAWMGEISKAIFITDRANDSITAIEKAREFVASAESEPPYHADVIIEASRAVVVPRSLRSGLERRGKSWLFRAVGEHQQGYPVFAEQDDRWLLLPLLEHTTAIALEMLPGDVLLHKLIADDVTRHPTWDTSLSALVSVRETLPLRVSDAIDLADTLRYGKALNPNNANVAGYLYDVVGDIDNIRRTAHYMVRDSTLPIDLALLAADNVRWLKNQHGFWEVRADLPAVAKEPEAMRGRPSFAGAAFEAKSDVAVSGILPIFRQGWVALQEFDRFEHPPLLSRIAESLPGGSAVLLDNQPMMMLAELFEYELVTDTREK